MARLLVSLGIPVSDYSTASYGRRYEKALLQIIDWETRKIEKQIEYVSERSDEWPNVSILFKGAVICGDECWVVTNTEIVVYDRHSWQVLRIKSHPTFNDLHSVAPCDAGYYVCNTGLEIVQFFDHDDNFVRFENIASTPTESRFDLSQDFRNVASTKPHEVHPNHVFFLDGEPWVTRCMLRDAANLGNLNETSETFPGGCHDGHVFGERTFFSTVNGHICAIDNQSRKLAVDIDVNVENQFNLVVGWTRGLGVSGNRAFLGNTALRDSKSMEFAKFVKKLAGGKVRMRSAIIEVGLDDNEIKDIFELQETPGAAIYSIIFLDD